MRSGVGSCLNLLKKVLIDPSLSFTIGIYCEKVRPRFKKNALD